MTGPRTPQGPRPARPDSAAPRSFSSHDRGPPRRDERGPPRRDDDRGPPRRDDRGPPRGAERLPYSVDNDPPRRGAGEGPRRFDNEGPRRFDNDRPPPRRFDNDRPPPRRFDNEGPRRFDNDRPPPRRFDNEARPQQRDESEAPLRSERSERRSRETKVVGQNAVDALFRARPEALRRVVVTLEASRKNGPLLKWCAGAKIGYAVVESDELDRIADTVHHEGICAMALDKPVLEPRDLLAWASFHKGPARLVLLEDVGNPHNFGAILRVCAHFGVRAVLCAGETPGLSAAALRTAEGGAEWLDVVRVIDAPSLLELLKGNGFQVIATSSHAQRSLYDGDLPERAVVMFGSEGEGLSHELAMAADVKIAIPGSGALESLNVACASAVVLGELWRAMPIERDASSMRGTPAAGPLKHVPAKPPTSGVPAKRPPRGERVAPRNQR
jgi:TrmH RNA methyltransferase